MNVPVLWSSAWGLPEDASVEGWRIDAILHFANIAVLILGGVALVWLVASLILSRISRKSRYFHGDTLAEKFVPLLVAALVFFVVDGYLLFRSSSDLHGSILKVDEALATSDRLRVQIGARQWAWDIRYAGTDDKFDTPDDIYAVSELVIPAGRAIVFELASMDVVHSFYLPHFRIKQDVIPGAIGRGWFRAKSNERADARYEIACAQHCGVHHYQMRGEVRVLSEQAFLRWQHAMSEDALRMHAEDLRALDEEPSRLNVGKTWSDFAPVRNWAWPWQSSTPSQPTSR